MYSLYMPVVYSLRIPTRYSNWDNAILYFLFAFRFADGVRSEEWINYVGPTQNVNGVCSERKVNIQERY
jgi:hypothetical protein